MLDFADKNRMIAGAARRHPAANQMGQAAFQVGHAVRLLTKTDAEFRHLSGVRVLLREELRYTLLALVQHAHPEMPRRLQQVVGAGAQVHAHQD